MTPRLSPLTARVLPFGVYMGFVLASQMLEWAAPRLITPQFTAYLYPVKILATGLVLAACYSHYGDLDRSELRRGSHTLMSIATGVLVYILWINLDFPLATLGQPTAYDPGIGGSAATVAGLTVFRIAGAVLVVPLMEEVFWRSFLSRYLVQNDFMTVRPGTFTLFSFAGTTILFGLEHHYWLAGMVAGAAYNLVYTHTRSLAQCVLSHAVSNAALAIHVMMTGTYHFW